MYNFKLITLILLFSINVFAGASIPECKTAIVDFNKAHKDVNFWAQKFPGGEVALVVRMRDHKSDTRETSEFNHVVGICLSAGMENNLAFTNFGSDEAFRFCAVDYRTLGESCSQQKKKLTNVMQVKL